VRQIVPYSGGKILSLVMMMADSTPVAQAAGVGLLIGAAIAIAAIEPSFGRNA
jgi:hypothetical protein